MESSRNCTQSNLGNTQRLLWIDIFRTMAIMLVVIGHATGKFNTLIYQFHVSAFFWISGYVSTHDKDNILVFATKKFYTLVLPLFSVILLQAIGMFALKTFGKYELIFGEYDYNSIKMILESFVSTGKIYAWLAGAGWFLVVLFSASIISYFCWFISYNKKIVFLFFSASIFLYGFYCIRMQKHSDYCFDLAFVAQFFYCLGFVWKRIEVNIEKKIPNILYFFVAIFSFCVMKCVSHYSISTVDYTMRRFPNPILNTLLAINGIIFLFVLSKLLESIMKRINFVFSLVGENTLGILLWHFLFFKVAALLLFLLGVTTIEEIARVTPSNDVGIRYWWLYTVVTIVLSVLWWLLLKKIYILNFFMGTNRRVISWIKNCKFVSSLHFQINDKIRIIIRRFIVLVYCIILMIYVAKMWKWNSSSVLIEFPNRIPSYIVEYGDGWLPQGDEEYRWINRSAELVCNSHKHNKILIEGYVPENFTEVSKVEIIYEEKVIFVKDVRTEHYFLVDEEVSNIPVDDKINIVISFDGVHLPSGEDVDQRQLSGMIRKIELK